MIRAAVVEGSPCLLHGLCTVREAVDAAAVHEAVAVLACAAGETVIFQTPPLHPY